MCGIFAVINKSQKLDINKCRKSLNSLNKRGPDWKIEKVINDKVFLGQAVLSMTGEKKKNINQHYSVTKNFFVLLVGEIYNYKKLSDENLGGLDINLTSDTKILANLFEKKTINEVNTDIDGMYAYILFDQKKNNLLISRDPNGEKSLYVYQNSKEIIISSEINPILLYKKNIKLNINILKNYFLTRHFISLEESIFNDIKKINPGDQIKINLSNFTFKKMNQIQINSYINEDIYRRNLKRKEVDLIDELDFLLKKNIKEMIPQNRKYAAIVSGGIDSSLVSHYICSTSKPDYLIFLNHIGKDWHTKKIKTFEKYLKNKIGIHNITENTYYKNYLKSIKICNSPINSHSFVGNFINSSIVKKMNCRALFGGEGADELFGGYETYLPKHLRDNPNITDYTKIFKNTLFKDTKDQILFKEKMKIKRKESLNSYSFISEKYEKEVLSMMLMDATVQMESNAFRGSDLMSMNNSVESRSLFYRKDIIRFALNLPLKFKINTKSDKFMMTKNILKKLFLKKFPKKLILKKQGFAGFPNELKKYVGSIEKFIICKYINSKDIKKKYFKNKQIQWKILNTELYLKNIGKKYL